MGAITKLLLVMVLSLLLNNLAVAEVWLEQKVVMQMSAVDKKSQEKSLSQIETLKKYFEPGELKIEIVVYGEGLSLLTKSKKNKLANSVTNLIKRDVTFSACNETMKKIEQKTGKKIQLIDGVKVVPAGIVRVVRLQGKGYSYIRP